MEGVLGTFGANFAQYVGGSSNSRLPSSIVSSLSRNTHFSQSGITPTCQTGAGARTKSIAHEENQNGAHSR